PEGLGVLVRASHQCMELRGVNHSGLVTTTSLLGSFQENPVHRAEFFALSHAPEGTPT
ncbi:MAG: GTP cyclohydrolase I, partial [Candidatus Lambdaproteobacteria bacterium]|nr:GTP cyclohydrolase I [Candidatus Lambdaproteobacteria bacterium]